MADTSPAISARSPCTPPRRNKTASVRPSTSIHVTHASIPLWDRAYGHGAADRQDDVTVAGVVVGAARLAQVRHVVEQRAVLRRRGAWVEIGNEFQALLPLHHGQSRLEVRARREQTDVPRARASAKRPLHEHRPVRTGALPDARTPPAHHRRWRGFCASLSASARQCRSCSPCAWLPRSRSGRNCHPRRACRT